jgi:hypothetical protein
MSSFRERVDLIDSGFEGRSFDRLLDFVEEVSDRFPLVYFVRSEPVVNRLLVLLEERTAEGFERGLVVGRRSGRVGTEGVTDGRDEATRVVEDSSGSVVH